MEDGLSSLFFFIILCYLWLFYVICRTIFPLCYRIVTGEVINRIFMQICNMNMQRYSLEKDKIKTLQKRV